MGGAWPFRASALRTPRVQESVEDLTLRGQRSGITKRRRIETDECSESRGSGPMSEDRVVLGRKCVIRE